MQARVRVALVLGMAALAGAVILFGFRAQQMPPADSPRAARLDAPPTAAADGTPDSLPTAAGPSVDPRALLQQARAHLDAGQAAAAAPLVARVLELRPGHAGAWNALGRTELGLGHVREAEAAFRRACDLDSTQAYARNNLGWLYLQQGRFSDALPWLESAVRLQAGVATFQNNLGVAYERLHRWEDASAAYARAVELEPARINARLSLARVSAHLDPALAAVLPPVDSLAVRPVEPSKP